MVFYLTNFRPAVPEQFIQTEDRDVSFFVENPMEIFKTTKHFDAFVAAYGIEKALELVEAAIVRRELSLKKIISVLFGSSYNSFDIINKVIVFYFDVDPESILNQELESYLSPENRHRLCMILLTKNPDFLLQNIDFVLLWAHHQNIKTQATSDSYSTEIDSVILLNLLLSKFQQDQFSPFAEMLSLFCSTYDNATVHKTLSLLIHCSGCSIEDVTRLITESGSDVTRLKEGLFCLLLNKSPELIFHSSKCINNLYLFCPISKELMLECVRVIPDALNAIIYKVAEEEAESFIRSVCQIAPTTLLRAWGGIPSRHKDVVFNVLLNGFSHLLLSKNIYLSLHQKERLYQYVQSHDPKALIKYIATGVENSRIDALDMEHAQVVCDIAIELESSIDECQDRHERIYHIIEKISDFFLSGDKEKIDRILQKPKHMRMFLILVEKLGVYGAPADLEQLAVLCSDRKIKEHKELRQLIQDVLIVLLDERVSTEHRKHLIHYISQPTVGDRRVNLALFIKKAKAVTFASKLPGGIEKLGEIVNGEISFFSSLAEGIAPMMTHELWDKYRSTFGTWEDPYAILRYLYNLEKNKHRMPKEDFEKVMRACQLFIEAVCRGEEGWRSLRSQETKHTSVVNNKTPGLLEIWSKDRRKLLVDEGIEVLDTDNPQLLFLAPTLIPTCQSVDNPDVKLTKCLLSYALDPKNRFLVVIDKHGHLIARAIFRLLLDENNMPVLFLEAPYPKVRSPLVDREIITMAQERAQELGLKLHISQHFVPRAEEKVKLTSLASPIYEYCDSILDADGALYRGVTTGEYSIFI